MPRTVEPADLSAVDPGRCYRTAIVAALLGVTQETVQHWIQGGLLPAVKLPRGHYRVLGSEILSRVPGGRPEPTETTVELDRRAAAELERINRLKRGRPCQAS